MTENERHFERSARLECFGIGFLAGAVFVAVCRLLALMIR